VRGEDWQNEVDKILQHPLKNEFYENVSFELGNRYENINVRALHVGGWYDMFCQGTIDGYEKYNMGSDYASDHQLLVMGPWFHGFTNEHEDLTYPEQGHDEGMELINSLEATLFGEYLKDEIVDWETLPRVYYYVMGDPEHANSTKTYNEWRTAEEWPVSHTPESWYFHPNGTLSPHKPTQGEYVSYLYDPRDPVPNGGGTTLTLDYIGAVDQRRVEYETSPYDENEEFDAGWSAEDRSDILKFESPVLTEPVEFVGNISADLYVKSNCTDTDFTVKLMDVYPDGREMWVADGILKARFREGFQQETFLNPGQPYRLNIDMWSSAYRFVPGHKIKISISSSNWDKFAINPNTGGEIDDLYPANFTRDGFEFNIANNSIACGLGEKESCLWLPRTN